MTTLAQPPKLQFFDANGDPLVGGKLYTYAAGTTTPLASYTDYGGLTPNSNPVILDSRGEASVWLGSALYKLRLTTATDVDIWTVDNVNAANGPTLADLANTTSATEGAGLIGYGGISIAYPANTVGAALQQPVLKQTVDYANTSGTEKLVNGTFTGSATGWSLTNFTYGANAIAHSAGTVGTASQSVALDAYKHYKLTVVITTTTRGYVDFQFAGVTMLDDVGYYPFDVGTSVTFTFPYLSGAAATATFRALTDTSWAGSIESLSVIEITQEMPLIITSVPTDDTTQRIPNGLKMGRYNAGVLAYGDRQTMAFGEAAAVWNVAIGPRSLQGNIGGFENTAVGAFAGRWTTTNYNTYFGYSAGKYNTLGEQLTGIGFKALGANTVGVRNSGLGHHALLQNTSGNDNTAGGWQALYNILTTSANTAWGSQTGMNSRGIQNTFIGALAGYLNANVNITYTYSYGTMVGSQAVVYGENGTALGFNTVVGADGSPVDNATAIGANTTNRRANSVKVGSAVTAFGTAGRMFDRQASNSDGSTSGITYTAAQFTTTALTRSGPSGSFSDTTPSAAQIVAEMPGPEANMGYEIIIRNTTNHTLTLLAGSGVTLGGTTTVGGNKARLYKVIVTNATSGAEAVTVVGCMQGDT